LGNKPSVMKTSAQPIPYQEPSLGGLPDTVYSLEVSLCFCTRV